MHGKPTKPFRHTTLGMMASLGARRAVAQLPGNRVLTGFLAWFLWRTYYLSRLPGLDRKLRVAFDWTLDMLFPRDIAELRVYSRRARSSAAADGGLPPRRGNALGIAPFPRRPFGKAERRSMKFREPIERLIRDPKEFTRDVPFPDPADIRIYDETLRDGEQMPGICYTPEQKLEIARALADVGVHVMSVGFPAASAGDRLTLQFVMDAKRRGELGNVEIVVMCRSNRTDIDVTAKTLHDAGVHPREVTFFVFTSGSDLHLKYKIGKTLLKWKGRDESEWLDLPLSFYRAANIRLAVRSDRARS